MSRGGRNKDSWAHPLLFFKIAISIHPSFEIEVFEWVRDNSCILRNAGGDSYKSLSDVIKDIYPEDKRKGKIIYIAKKIKKHLGVTDWNECDAEQLMIRDKIHKDIISKLDMSDDIKKIIDITLKKPCHI